MSFPSTLQEPSITDLDAMEWKEGKCMNRSFSENIAVHECCIRLLLSKKIVAVNIQNDALLVCLVFL